jgi:hypothetical protein
MPHRLHKLHSDVLDSKQATATKCRVAEHDELIAIFKHRSLRVELVDCKSRLTIFVDGNCLPGQAGTILRPALASNYYNHPADVNHYTEMSTALTTAGKHAIAHRGFREESILRQRLPSLDGTTHECLKELTRVYVYLLVVQPITTLGLKSRTEPGSSLRIT